MADIQKTLATFPDEIQTAVREILLAPGLQMQATDLLRRDDLTMEFIPRATNWEAPASNGKTAHVRTGAMVRISSPGPIGIGGWDTYMYYNLENAKKYSRSRGYEQKLSWLVAHEMGHIWAAVTLNHVYESMESNAIATWWENQLRPVSERVLGHTAASAAANCAHGCRVAGPGLLAAP